MEIRNKYVTALENVYHLRTNNNWSIAVNAAPFSNCQNFSINAFKRLIMSLEDKSTIRQSINEIKRLCGIGKPFLIVDLQKSWYIQIRKYLKFISKQFYTNANGSRMVLCIIDTRESSYVNN